ncbi:MAG: bifunctional [glutamate--ammonia ligase]-adenylyl-L-tyrosine phosphorylase/[glutamate--ammonia-ligase] adenylyltransferase [bacterium]|nr:bifunctional [glutamate--ammonia ligase]-adenylyl-L-tyrosine phosphorylase/[glutamate--ammonia-ligase] adenylyltransferase [bacterium]
MELSKIPFEDRNTAERNFKQLSESLFDQKTFDLVYPNLIKFLGTSPDPDLALTNFERYSSAVLNKTELYTFLAHNQIAFDYLIRLFSASQFITDVLIRNPEYFDWLLEDRELRMQKGYHEMCLELRSILSSLQSTDRQYSALRRFHRRELLRIGARDILGLAEFKTVTAELSDLASGLLQIACEMVTPGIQKQFGIPQSSKVIASEAKQSSLYQGFSIIGMGKLGGYELNMSSDIDILFVYGEEKETSVGVSHFEYYNALAEAVVQVLTKMTAQGYVYRVDTRLRPEGSAGPLARSLESYEEYYQSYAETWERIALIKARPVAGDESVGKQFTELIVPFVYRRTLDYTAIEEIQHMKLRLQSEATKLTAVTDEVKSGVGGIREIEFTVSLLQLFYGGKEKVLRESNTLRAIQRLQEKKYLSAGETDKLTEAYIFLRNVEHRLQSMALLQTHTLPTEPEALQKLARKLGYQDTVINSTPARIKQGQNSKLKSQSSKKKTAALQFQEDYKRHTDFVHTIFSNLFTSEKVTEAKSKQMQFEQFLNPAVSLESVYQQLKKYQFVNPEQALSNLQKLNATAAETVSPNHTRKLMLSILPQLFETLSASPDPDNGLNLFERYLRASKAATAVYSVLAQEPELTKSLVTLFATSDYLSRILIQQPALFDLFLHSSTATQFPAEVGTQFIAPEKSKIEEAGLDKSSPYYKLLPKLRDAEIFRIGLQDILHKIDTTTLHASFTQLAENGLKLIYQFVVHEVGARHLSSEALAKVDALPYAIFALGKLGAYEMTYGSDLDLIFIYDDTEFEFYNVLSEKIILYSNDYFLPVDPRLRPEGGKGILALSLDAYQEYFNTRASFWERLAYTRARFILGDKKLGDKFERLIQQFVYQSPLPEDIRSQVSEMRLKMQKQAEDKYPGAKHLKTGSGGLVDIEFTLQYFQLKFGGKDERWRTAKMEELFNLLTQEKVLPKKVVDLLQTNHQFLSNLQNKVRLTTEITANTLPKEELLLTRIASLMEFKNSEQLLTEYQKTTESTRKLFQKILGK